MSGAIHVSRGPQGGGHLMKYHRNPFGYTSADRQVFIERGAPMSGGGTAWLVWLAAVPSDRLEFTVSGSAYDHRGNYARTLAENVTGDYTPMTKQQAAGRDDWMLHLADAGTLAEAKHTAELILAERKAAAA